jgi:hypothetical protein
MARVLQLPSVPTTDVTVKSGPIAQAWQIFFANLVAYVVGLNRTGTAAARPAATDVLPGTLYKSTDTGDISISDGTAWN